jgi:flavin reductase (DIM6/NTAB) family NADH-FMN oxidoreductase RutF
MTHATWSSLNTNQDLDPVRLREAFGLFPTGVVAVAAEVEGSITGLAASSFTSVSLEPPLVSVNLARTSKTWPALRRAPRLGVTVLAEDHADLCRQLAGPVEQRFDGIAHTVGPRGAVTLDEGLARFECSVYREVEAGDHVLVLLQLHTVSDSADVPDGNPLVFHRSAFGRLERPAP